MAADSWLQWCAGRKGGRADGAELNYSRAHLHLGSNGGYERELTLRRRKFKLPGTFQKVRSWHLAIRWFAVDFCRGLSRYHWLGGHRPDVSLFGYLAACHQHGNDDCHVPDGFSDPKHAEPRHACRSPETRRVDSGDRKSTRLNSSH